MYNCGRFNHKITFCRQKSYDHFDEERLDQQLTVIRTVWGSVKPTTSKENFEEQRLYNTVTYDIRTRYIPELLDTELIILYHNERFEIRSAVNIGGRNEEIAFTCISISKGNSDGS